MKRLEAHSVILKQQPGSKASQIVKSSLFSKSEENLFSVVNFLRAKNSASHWLYLLLSL